LTAVIAIRHESAVINACETGAIPGIRYQTKAISGS